MSVKKFQMETKTFKEGVFKMGKCTIIVAIENGKWHLSISKPNAQPSYKEMKEARYRLIPDNVTMAQIFPTKSEFVNLHEYCHHLWEIENQKDK